MGRKEKRVRQNKVHIWGVRSNAKSFWKDLLVLRRVFLEQLFNLVAPGPLQGRRLLAYIWQSCWAINAKVSVPSDKMSWFRFFLEAWYGSNKWIVLYMIINHEGRIIHDNKSWGPNALIIYGDLNKQGQKLNICEVCLQLGACKCEFVHFQIPTWMCALT